MAANGAARSALGVAAIVVPAVPLAPWVGADRHRGSARLLARALGGRDLALGLGTLGALRSGGPLRPWVLAGALADAGDLAVTLLDWDRLPRAGRIAVATAAASGVLAAAVAVAASDSGAE